MREDIEYIVINKVVNGDELAYRYIIDRYKNFVFNIAFKVLRNHEDAEEVTQDSFLKAYKALKNFKGDCKFSTWLYRIAFNSAVSRTRKNVISKENIDDVPEIQFENVDNLSAIENINRNERKIFINKALEKLSDEEQVLVTLFYFEENSIAEVSEVTGLDSNNVKVKIHRARKKLYVALCDQLQKEVKEIL